MLPVTCTIHVSAPGKLVIVGEYALLAGKTALVAAINRVANVKLNFSKATKPVGQSFANLGDTPFSLSSSDPRIPALQLTVTAMGEIRWGNTPAEVVSDLRFFASAFSNHWPIFKERWYHIFPVELHVELDSQEFYHPITLKKYGFGSSAAMTVALVTAMSAIPGRPVMFDTELHDIFHAARAYHSAAQNNNGSGVDIAAAAWGGLLHYQKPTNTSTPVFAEPLVWPKDLQMLVINTGKSASTAEQLAQLQRFEAQAPQQYQQLMTEMGDISARAITCIIEGKTSLFLQAVAQYGLAMQRLGQLAKVPIYSPEHLEISRLVTESGAVYKPSGAGGGDVGILLTDSKTIIKKVRAAFKKTTYTILDTQLAPAGAAMEWSISLKPMGKKSK